MDPNIWFEHTLWVQPHHTDYAGIVWHGTYVAWMEETRVAYLRSHGIHFADWVAAGVDLPVVDLSIQYRQSLTMGMEALIKARFTVQGVRLLWHYDIQNRATGQSCVLGQVTLVPVDHQTRRIVRRLPDVLAADMKRLRQPG